METITASVGIAKGKQCYNVTSDQQKVQRLLSNIKAPLGGCEGKSDWAPAEWRKCAPDLYQAILNFQRINRFRLDYDPDGHVDPHDSTIVLMNQLVTTTDLPAGRLYPRLEPMDIDRTSTTSIGPLFASGFLETDWKLEGSGDSIAGSAAFAAGGLGSWSLSHKGVGYDLDYVYGGVSISPIPVSLSGGPSWMKSKGTKLYTHGSLPDLDFKDIRGPFALISGAIEPGVPAVGGYGSLIWFNTPLGAGAFGRIADALADEFGVKSRLPGILQHLNESAGAVAALAGVQFTSPDVSLTFAHGMAW